MRPIPAIALILLATFGCDAPEDAETPQPETVPNEQPAAIERTNAQMSRNEAALETLRAQWDSETITGDMVDEIKKVLDNGESEDLEPLLERLELLETSGDAYAQDFALWWEERGRGEVGKALLWKRDVLRDAITLMVEEGDEAEGLRLLREAAATGDPVARMWKMFADAEMGGRHDGAAFSEILQLVDEVKVLANDGDPEAAYLLGMVAGSGDMDIVNATPDDAVRWLETAANAGYPQAAQTLADLYSRGRHGFDRDPEKARKWADMAADARTPEYRANQLIATSANNLKQLGLVGKMFANESKGEFWPPLSSERGQLAMDPASVYPEYLTDVTVCVSPAHPDYYDLIGTAETDPKSVVRDHSYWYLGYAVNDETQGMELVEHLRDVMDANETYPDAFEAPALPAQQIFRLREGIERFFITDINDPAAAGRAQASIPVFIERPGMHPNGANVLYLDGHVEFEEYPGEFPMTETFIQALESLDDLKG